MFKNLATKVKNLLTNEKTKEEKPGDKLDKKSRSQKKNKREKNLEFDIFR